jgi:hypothetical protein
MRKRVATHPRSILREDVLPSSPGLSVSALFRNRLEPVLHVINIDGFVTP